MGIFFGAWPDGEIRSGNEKAREKRSEGRGISHDAAPCAERRKFCYIVPTKRTAQVLPRYPRYLLIYLIRPKRTVGPLRRLKRAGSFRD